jgi:acetyltransferase-like isoleucine patch superfamily enzyme
MTYIDEHAHVSPGAKLGDDVRIWAFTQVREDAVIGARTSIGSHAYIDAAVHIGVDCKIQSGALVFRGSFIGDGVFIGPAAVITNDPYPRALTDDGRRQSEDDWELIETHVGRGASLGAGSILVAGVTVGEWAMVAAGAVVTQDVAAYRLVGGIPAKPIGWVDRSGRPAQEPPAPGAS